MELGYGGGVESEREMDGRGAGRDPFFTASSELALMAEPGATSQLPRRSKPLQNGGGEETYPVSIVEGVICLVS